MPSGYEAVSTVVADRFAEREFDIVRAWSRPKLASGSVAQSGRGKRIMDLLLATLLLLGTAPFFGVIALLIRRDGGPAFFAHRRIGSGGQAFFCLKFRTMVAQADRVLEAALAHDPVLAAEWAATQKLRRDPRVTRIGRILRKTSLDELPQLINVLRGEMSLVGPRPIVPAEVRFYGTAIDYYFAVQPGLTGLWQVSGRSDTTYAQRVALDVEYARTRSIGRDMMVLLRTVPAVLSNRGSY